MISVQSSEAQSLFGWFMVTVALGLWVIFYMKYAYHLVTARNCVFFALVSNIIGTLTVGFFK